MERALDAQPAAEALAQHGYWSVLGRVEPRHKHLPARHPEISCVPSRCTCVLPLGAVPLAQVPPAHGSTCKAC